jgi:hypothetical protein
MSLMIHTHTHSQLYFLVKFIINGTHQPGYTAHIVVNATARSLWEPQQIIK